MVLIFTDLNKAQVYKMPYRDSLHQQIEIHMSFKKLNLLKPNEHTENYYIRGTNDKHFLFEIEGRKIVYVGEKVISFETADMTVEYSSNGGLNDVIYSYARGIGNIYFMLYRKYIPFKENENSRQKMSKFIRKKRGWNEKR